MLKREACLRTIRGCSALSKQFYCVRQQAGRLVKEYRGTIPPRYSATDTDEDRRDKSELKRQRRTVLNRDSTDRLELMIALMGDQATHYVLEFDDEHLPRSFADVRKALRSFLRRVERFRGDNQLDYIPAIEGKHGDHRYHIHLVADFRQLPAAVVQHLWTGGEVTDWPVFRRHGKTLGFRYLAKYLVKERSDGIIIPIGRHPWSCSRCLRAKLPPPEVWLDDSDRIEIPDGALLPNRRSGCNRFGSYNVATWIDP